jgi:ABC-type transport system involved in multi-copper enzyme maturation permease subunit
VITRLRARIIPAGILPRREKSTTTLSMTASASRSSPLSKIVTIAKNTFREAIRDRILYNLVLFVLLITASAIFLGELTAGQEARTIVNLGLTSMLFFGTFIAIFVGVSLVSKEIEKRTLYAIFSKPVRRSEFVVGKYLGLVMTLLVNTAVMGVGVSAALLFVGGRDLAAAIWGAIALIFLELTIITAVAIVFSTFSTPALSALFTFMIFVIGHFSSALRELANASGTRAAEVFFAAIYYTLPNLSNYSFIVNAAHGQTPSALYLGGAAAYALAYNAVLLTIAVLVFHRRNFK